MLSGDHAVLDEVFPETGHSALEPSAGRPAVSWTPVDSRHLVRFPLNGYCKLNSVQAITRLLNAGFTVAASTGGGVHGQQFSEYLFIRKMSN
jgi:BTB/POZ domain-containing protein KCTD1/15